MKKSSYLFPLLFLLLLILPATAQAFEVKTGSTVNLEENEIIEGNFYAIGNIITINGTINGDAYIAGQNINVNGAIEGDLFVVGENITINGPIGSSLRAVGSNIMINNEIKHSVHAFGANISLAKDASVGWDFFIAGAIGEFQGKIGGDLHGGAKKILIAGEIGKNVKLRLDKGIKNDRTNIDSSQSLEIKDTAIINGNVYYTAGAKGIISEEADIGGKTSYSLPEKKLSRDLAIAKAWGNLYSIFSSLVVGLVLVSLWRDKIKRLTTLMFDKASQSIGWGVVIMFLTPIIAFILLITIIGIPLSLIIIGLWLITLYLGKILVSIMIGGLIIHRLRKDKKESLVWAMIIGVAIVWFFTSLPLIGWALSLVAAWWGLGGIWLTFKKNELLHPKANILLKN